MKKVGIVGGIGPASTLDYYNGIISGVRELTKNEEITRKTITASYAAMAFLSAWRYNEKYNARGV